jgi:hypothetical protein
MVVRAKHLAAGSILTEDRDECQPHKFRISQIVTYRPDQRAERDILAGVYMITARLPESTNVQFEYRIKNLNVQHERVAKESELRGRQTVARAETAALSAMT